MGGGLPVPGPAWPSGSASTPAPWALNPLLVPPSCGHFRSHGWRRGRRCERACGRTAPRQRPAKNK
eukprot:1194700-Prorocentrum_minimum.AAC.1